MPDEKSFWPRDARRLTQELRTFFGETIWRPVPERASLVVRISRRASRYAYLIVRGFVDSRILVRAPALTLITLLAMVPLLALIVSVAKGFGYQQVALDYLREILTDFVVVGQQDVVDTVIGYVEGTNLRTLGGIGFLFLTYTAVSMLGTIEKSFNDIWGVAQSRPFHRKVIDYLGILIIFPVLLLASTGITASLSSNSFVGRLFDTDVLSGLTEFGVKLSPLLVVTLGFSFLYKYMPYTTVRLRSALIAGFLAGTVWHLAQWVFISLQIGVTQANVIYGTFAALPIFLIWLNASWIVVLMGCEIAYAVQHAATYHPPVPQGLVSIAQRERVALQILAAVWERFSDGKPPEPAGDVAADIDLPRPVTMEIVQALVQCELLVISQGASEGLVPARDLTRVGVGELLLAYRHAGRTSHGELGGMLHDRVVELHKQLEEGLRTEGSHGIGTMLAATRS
jgi:membrane protein